MAVRLDYRMIEEYVERGAHVLDLGCGDGALLEQLISQNEVEGCGIDVDLEQVRKCIARGVPVYHGDMLEGMAMFEDGRFDCVVLSQTLQQTLEPCRVVQEMLRVGRRAIISFPNFGQWQVRLRLLLGGRMPVTKVLPYRWHETPNIRPLTIKDFLGLCRELKLRIVDRIFLTADYGRLPGLFANLLASMAIFVVEASPGG
ncbi:MAG: methionine biosynthesis protein MetW [Candidatus Brocadiae bacterium]|nr:methionine biosynthesis protein MetW [Candidatus Brocadiia bacterium]